MHASMFQSVLAASYAPGQMQQLIQITFRLYASLKGHVFADRAMHCSLYSLYHTIMTSHTEDLPSLHVAF